MTSWNLPVLTLVSASATCNFSQTEKVKQAKYLTGTQIKYNYCSSGKTLYYPCLAKANFVLYYIYNSSSCQCIFVFLISLIICDFNIKHNQKPLNAYNYFGPSHKLENVLQHIYGMSHRS